MSEQLQDGDFESITVNDWLHLKAVKRNEAPVLYGLVDENREYLSEYLPWAKEQTLEDTKEFIAKTEADRIAADEYGFGVYLEGKLVGHMSLMYLGDDEKLPEIGYWVAKKASGRGVTSTAAAALSDFGLNVLNLPEIIIKADENNIGSNKVAEKLGYTAVAKEESEGKVLNIWRKQNEQAR